jgi:hypothetical protein
VATKTFNALTAPLRAYGSVLFGGYEEPHAEVMALVWGPRFDREHAHTLLERSPGYVLEVLHTVQSAANQFDQLTVSEQRRVRQLILRHRSRCDNTQTTQ